MKKILRIVLTPILWVCTAIIAVILAITTTRTKKEIECFFDKLKQSVKEK